MKTNKAKHTPGPWQVVDSSDKRRSGYIRRVDAPVGEMAVAQVMSGRPWGEWKANARLIASAPELLKALKEAYEHLEYCGYGDSYERECATENKLSSRLSAAIAKAEGE